MNNGEKQQHVQTQDKWSQWLLHRRFGGDRKMQEETMKMLGEVRDEILKNANIQPGETVLDAGCGDGLLGVKALEQAGEKGNVVFLDISADILNVVREFVAQAGLAARTQFVQNPVEAMRSIPTGSVDVLVARSVLIYVKEKQQAFDECFRVLSPSGRISLCEPINRFMVAERGECSYFGFDLTPVRPLWEKIRAMNDSPAATDSSQNPMLDFDERDLLEFSKKSGFKEIALEYDVQITHKQHATSWEAFYRSAPNPNAQSLEEKVNRALTPAEQEQFVQYFKSVVESGGGKGVRALAFLRAGKQ